ncbi:MAG: hypothetical protein QM451_09750 [Bacillota bacterium]|jgi:hypothetical protein|nr:hypothetical protein [Bacillota bacterium]HHT90953.1 hypothetical protein [Bacillota bacterium]
MKDCYEDIIHRPRPISKARRKMALLDRAAQFSPFAALSGYEAAVKETARITEEKVELDEYVLGALSRKLQILADRLAEAPEVSITHFQPDSKKPGGRYITALGQVQKIKEYERIVVLSDGREIPIEEIVKIDGEIFDR